MFNNFFTLFLSRIIPSVSERKIIHIIAEYIVLSVWLMNWQKKCFFFPSKFCACDLIPIKCFNDTGRKISNHFIFTAYTFFDRKFEFISPFIYSSENIFVFYKIINCMTFVKQTLMAIIKLKFLFFEQDFFFKILDLKIQQLAAHQHCHYLISLLKVQIK